MEEFQEEKKKLATGTRTASRDDGSTPPVRPRKKRNGPKTPRLYRRRGGRS